LAAARARLLPQLVRRPPPLTPHPGPAPTPPAGGNWQKADEFFRQMAPQGCKPDSITYSALISAHQRAGQWQRALRAFEAMQAEGLHPDSVVFNTLLEVLWQSGVAMAQLRATQLWSAANRSGQFRCAAGLRAEGRAGQGRAGALGRPPRLPLTPLTPHSAPLHYRGRPTCQQPRLPLA
jgi:pentatricopeptide repeat protein